MRRPDRGERAGVRLGQGPGETTAERAGDATLWRVGWRLIGANNRELGRSAAVFESFDLCRAAVLRLREGADQARVLFAMSDPSGKWTWRLELGGQQAAMSGRTYQRQREAQHNLSLFLTAVPLAQLTGELPPGLVVPS
jgi:hypothetical protein